MPYYYNSKLILTPTGGSLVQLAPLIVDSSNYTYDNTTIYFDSTLITYDSL